MQRIQSRQLLVLVTGLLATIALPTLAAAQNPNARRLQQQRQQLQKQQREMQRRLEKRMKDAVANQPDLPSDPQLLSLHKEFISKAEKLAGEYERKKQYDRAREVFEAMTRLVPKYPEAQEGLQRMLQLQTMKDRRIAEVSASQGWQDTGAELVQGMPVHVEVKGEWTVVLQTGPEGVEIPDELKPRDSRIKLGTLIGVIAESSAQIESAKPFLVKPGDDFVADRNGRLFLRMFDLEPSDNQGKMLVLIQSTFGK